MRHLILTAGILAFLGGFGGCSSGGGCDSGDKKGESSGESTSLPGGGSSHGGGGEAVSFQGLGKKDGSDAAQGGQVAAAASALGGGSAAPAKPAVSAAGAAPPQSVICGGFPNLAADCKTDPVFSQVQQKCCPGGQVDQCQAIPGGARLIGRGCTASASR